MTSQLMDLFDSRPAAVALNDLRRKPVEQVQRQSERLQPLKLLQLLFQRLDTGGAGIGAKLMQRDASTLRLIGEQQRVQTLSRGNGQNTGQSTAELFLEGCDGRPNQPFNAIRRKRLDTQLTAPCGDCLLEPLYIALVREQMFQQPTAHRVYVFNASLAKAHGRTDLSAVILKGPAFPAVLVPCFGRDMNLIRQEPDRRQRQFLSAPGKAAFGLKELQQRGKAQTSGPRLVRQQLPITRVEGPSLGEIVRGELQFHVLSPS